MWGAKCWVRGMGCAVRAAKHGWVGWWAGVRGEGQGFGAASRLRRLLLRALRTHRHRLGVRALLAQL